MLLNIILLWMAAQAAAAIFPAIVEVDLIFPRNESTYAPSADFPIVFAIQNPALAPLLDPGFSLTVWDLSNLSHAQNPWLDLKNANFSGSDPIYVHSFISNLPASKYSMEWAFGAGNCSNAFGGERPRGGYQSHSVVFTIQGGAQQPNIAPTAAEEASCANLTHFAFNITGSQPVTPERYNGRNSCAIFSDTQSFVEGNPCAVQVSSQSASSISAAIAGPTETSKPNAASSKGFAGTVLLGGLVAAMVAM